MDYDLTRQRYGNIENSIGVAYETGDMPSSALTSKFEETDIGLDEELYDDYARRTLVDKTPDKNKFEYEEPRGGVNASSGFLQHRYYGHRGTADWEKPEIFLGFGGVEDRDPRGVTTDPDMKQMAEQDRARMRFVRWTPDGSDHITGGGRSESQVMADQQKLFRVARDRLKVFSRQIDGRRNPSQRTYRRRSTVDKQQLVRSYGDFIHDYALTPQRRANFIAKSIIRDSADWRAETSDQNFEISKYTQLCRRSVSKDTYKRVSGAQGGNDSSWSDADTSKCYKAAGILMSNIIRGKKQALANAQAGGIDYAQSKQTIAYKTAPFAKDLAMVLTAITTDQSHGNSDVTVSYKTAAPTMQHVARQILHNHVAPAHHYLNAEVLYKSVKPGADTSRIKTLVQTDASSPQIQDLVTIGGKTAKMQMIAGAKLDTEDDMDKAESASTVNYKHLLNPNGDRRIRITDGEDYKSESDNTQTRANNHVEYRITTTNDVETGIDFFDNTYKERHLRGIGSKYTNRLIDTDAKTDSITSSN